MESNMESLDLTKRNVFECSATTTEIADYFADEGVPISVEEELARAQHLVRNGEHKEVYIVIKVTE